MYFSYFVTFWSESDSTASITDKDLKGISEIITTTPGLKQAKLYTPETAQDYYTDDGPPPKFIMQLYFEDLKVLEEAIGRGGHLQELAMQSAWPSLSDAHVTQQVMLTRSYPVMDRTFNVHPGGLPCTYLVHYPGEAYDLNEWLSYYLGNHPDIMKKFPDVREIEIYTRIDWIDAMPWQRVNYMQRNKVVFDSPEALTRANNSSVRHQMRSDFEKFPPFEGGCFHYPMATTTIC